MEKAIVILFAGILLVLLPIIFIIAIRDGIKYRVRLRANNKRIIDSLINRVFSLVLIVIVSFALAWLMKIIINNGISILNYEFTLERDWNTTLLLSIVRGLFKVVGISLITIGGIGDLLYLIIIIFSINHLLIRPNSDYNGIKNNTENDTIETPQSHQKDEWNYI